MFKVLRSVFIVLFLDILTDIASSIRPKVECGYKQCPQTRDGALNVHLIPHSHMDAGWVKTFDEYYYGTRTTISTANVHLIFHSVLSELLHDKRRKFTFSETAYFWRWWKEQRPATRATFRSLVQEGRIEFAGGGWTQNDEATVDYLQIIDHFTWGLRKLNDTLGPCGKPKSSWQIDTYGHSREMTSLLAQMGYDGLFIGRVDHKERESMIEEDRMEYMWRGSDVLGKMSDIMTHTLFNLYNAPEGFCFDFLCSDEPIVDDPDNQVYNAEKRVNDFILQIERQAKYYDHDNIVVTMGGDFTYQSAANWFMNMDKLINHVNTHPGNISDVNIFYSTPSCYLKAIYLYGRRDKAIYTEKGDHLPYGSDSSTYWTGYYTSRPSLKYFVRKAHTFLQVVKQLTVIARMGDSFELHLLRHATNLVLHHDAITGTSQQHVTNDFIRMLSEAVDACTKKLSNLLSYLTPTWGGTRRSKNSQQFVVCHQLNISQCRFTETQESMMLIVYNPLSVKTYHHVRLPAIALHYSIRDWNDEEVEYQLVPLPAAVINLPGRSSTVIQELYFEAENIPPLGYSAYYIAPVRDQLEENEFAKKHNKKEKNAEEKTEIITNIANEYLKVTANKDTGLLESIQHVDGAKVDISQNFYFYSQAQQSQQSGAYCFRPENARPTPVAQKTTFTVIRGAIVKEIRQRFTDWATQVIRLYRGEEFVEFEWVIGPIPIGTDLGKEVVSIFSTNVTSGGQFYTDSNARQMMKRTCWNESATQQQKKPVSACYYPVVSRICLHSANTSTGLCVLTDRAQGGTSYREGEVELMLHRRLLTDDGFGLEESLNEEAYGVGLVVKGKHRIVFGNIRQEVEDLTFTERIAAAARRWQMEPWLFMTAADKINRRKWQNVRNKRYSALRLHGLPRHIHVLTLEPWKGGSVLLRLENTLEKSARGRFRNEKSDGPEDFVNKASHITVQLRKLFIHLKIKKVRETTLAANQWLDDARQMDWSTRYVYQGADDDILPEDNVDYEDKSKPVKDRQEDEKDYKDPVNYSEEEEYHRRRTTKQKKKNRNKTQYDDKYESNYRRRRSTNETDNVLENVINGTFNDKYTEKDFNNNIETSNNTLEEQDFVITTTEASVTNVFYKTSTENILETTSNVTILPDISIATYPFSLSKNVQEKFLQVTRRPRNFNSQKKSRLSNSFADLNKPVDDVDSSEEDFSMNFKKKTLKRRNMNKNAKKERRVKELKEEIPKDAPDDGITKSIFDMYYKSQPRVRTIKSQGMKPQEVKESRDKKKTVTEKTRRKGRRRLKMRRYKGGDDYADSGRSHENRQDSHRMDYEDIVIPEAKEEREESVEVGRRRPKSTKKTKKLSSDITFFAYDRSRPSSNKKRGYLEDSVEGEDKEAIPKLDPSRMRSRREREDLILDEDALAEIEDLGYEEHYGERKKRAAPEDATEAPTSETTEPAEEPDYIITLRPTQIRTFVIYFESNFRS